MKKNHVLKKKNMGREKNQLKFSPLNTSKSQEERWAEHTDQPTNWNQVMS